LLAFQDELLDFKHYAEEDDVQELAKSIRKQLTVPRYGVVA